MRPFYFARVLQMVSGSIAWTKARPPPGTMPTPQPSQSREYIQKGQASQSWYLRPAGTHQGKTAYLIVNAKSGKCLDGPGNEFGKLYHIWGCDPNNTNQRFIINTVM